MLQTDLSIYNNYPFNPGGNPVKRLLWYYINALFFKTGLLPVSSFKSFLLRIFGAKVGKGLTIKPGVNIKYPWNLIIGNHVWLGENVWIDNLVEVALGNNVCISQGAVILTGNHNYKKPSFDLITGCVTVADGAWIGAFAVVNPGLTISTHAVLTTGSVANRNMESYSIYQGNPAFKIRDRVMVTNN